MDALALILLASGALLVRLGYACWAAGLVRSKNAVNVVLRHVVDLCVATLAFWAVGAALFQYDGGGLIGLDVGRFIDWRGDADERTFFGLVLVLLASGIVPGAVAERGRLLPAVVISILIGGIIVPLAGQWAWQGWLAQRGFIDTAGASVVHLTGATVAVAAAMLTGARSGKYNRDRSANMIPGHNVPLAAIGLVILIIAWVPYVVAGSFFQAGSTLRTPMNVVLSGAAAGAVSLMISRWRYGKIDVLLSCAGILGGLVAISAGAGTFPTWAAVATGAVAGLVVPLAAVRLDLSLRIDDPVMAVAIHGLGALWGVLAVGIFNTAGEMSWLVGVLNQLLGAGTAILIALVISLPVLFLLKITIGLRVKEGDEADGLDLAEHDLNAYPDFQQTMIKSYHLREA